MKVKKLVFAAVVLLIAIGAWAYLCRPRQPNVLVILIDTLRADHLSMNGYPRETSPAIDKFAAENLNFKQAVAPAPWTPASVASLFTGLYPSSHGMVPPNNRGEAKKRSARLAEGWLTLAELFKQNGYVTAAVSPNPWVKQEFGFAQGFDHYVYNHRAQAGAISREAKKLLSGWEAEEAPFFLYLHYLDPHDPYTPPAPYDTMFGGVLSGWEYPEKQVSYLNRYDGEIRYTDDRLRDLFGYLKERGLYDDLVIVLLADHGEQFMEHGHQGHGFNVYNVETHVPLIVKAKGRRGEEAGVVSLVDIYPTLVEAAQLANAPRLEGLSLLGERQRSGVMSEIKRVVNEKAFVDSDGLKLVMEFGMEQDYRLPANAEPQRSTLYDSLNDYSEKTPLTDAAAADKLKAAFKKLYQAVLRLQPKSAESNTEVDKGTLKELESLGYM